MKIFTPAYYHQFHCIASACPDSCCKEWDVDVDDASAVRYRALPGALGDRLREVLQDTDDGTVMTIQDGRCPMWRQDGLCRIQAELGHEALCSVCQQFPRLTHDYGDFVERDLELVAETGCAYHVCHVSTKESVGLLREAKRAGLDVTAETGPHYLTMTDADLRSALADAIHGANDHLFAVITVDRE